MKVRNLAYLTLAVMATGAIATGAKMHHDEMVKCRKNKQEVLEKDSVRYNRTIKYLDTDGVINSPGREKMVWKAQVRELRDSLSNMMKTKALKGIK